MINKFNWFAARVWNTEMEKKGDTHEIYCMWYAMSATKAPAL